MKRFLSLIAIAFSLTTSAQVKSYCLAPSCTQTITTADSVIVSASLLSSDGFKAITWTQSTGQTVPMPTSVVTNANTMQGTSSFVLKGLPVGAYGFTATGTSITGVTGSGTAFVIVKAAPVPRKVISTTSRLVNGIWVQTFLYDDGSTQ